ncbi:MAG TPA: alpha-glucan family phosphorylase [Candidatus Krumholzibacteria bacterium]|nr:alpha-glucan family phosphorylase [Candidatus Krumholzibacteria bacterium]
MPAIRKFVVTPDLPAPLRPLLDIARNMWWSWNVEAINLLRRVDPDAWDRHDGNPVAVLGALGADRVRELERDKAFLAHLERVRGDLERYLTMPSWFEGENENIGHVRIAYFSLEFGLHESLPLYSGGLGILAGDHLKSASDLGLPLVGVGLAYQYGYFRQYLNHDGWQMEKYPVNDFYNMSMQLERDADNKPRTIEVHYPGRTVTARIWRVLVGRNPLLLLDTNLPENLPEDREITSRLYGGDNDLRIRQEIMLGIGGLRALMTLGLEPDVCHLNEGHSAFLGLERINLLMKNKGLDYATAFELVRASNVFTTHTPVPAGNDHFPRELVEKYLKSKADELGIGIEGVMALGRQNPADTHETFCMTVLALRLSRFANGVSELHSHVSRNMWQKVWPGVPAEEIPISHVTNGIHTRSWLCSEIARLYERYLGPRWYEEPTSRTIWDRVDQIPDAELWRSHERMRERLVSFVRRRLRKQLQDRGANRAWIRQASEVLDPEALTIGFARRFATYKRASLILRDPARLSRILNNPQRPVQLVFAGKAHPADNPGKELIRQLIHLASQEEFRKRIVFVEDYNIEVARYMVQGVDVWLNTPRRPLEASGTSGMKCPPNGGINLSVLDGWWCEGYHQDNGWAIGAGEDYDDQEYQDEVESRALFELLENEIIPKFYERSSDDVPREWTRVMKNSMRTVNAEFNTNRMLEEYSGRFYVPCLENARRLGAEAYAKARELADWRRRVRSSWGGLKVLCVEEAPQAAQPMGSSLGIRALVDLGGLSADEVLVEVFHGPLDAQGEIGDGDTTTMQPGEKRADGTVFTGAIPCTRAGRRGYTVRAVPRKDGFPLGRFETGLISWWDDPDRKPCDDHAPATGGRTKS